MLNQESSVDISTRHERVDRCNEGKRIVAILLIMCIFLLKDTALNLYKEEPWPDIPPELKLGLLVIEDMEPTTSRQYNALYLSVGFFMTSGLLTCVELSTTFLLGSIATGTSLILTLTLDETQTIQRS